MSGFVRDVQIVGNIVQGCTLSGIEFQELAQFSRDVLIANNTVFECNVGWQLVNRAPLEGFTAGQAEIVGNLFFATDLADMISLRATNESPELFPVDGKPIIDAWRVRTNWRDASGQFASSALPLADRDRYYTDWRFVSRERDDADYMRPLKGSDLENGGAGGDLPTYAGAVPPEGVAPWIWDITWQSRSRRSAIGNSRDESAAQKRAP